LAGEVLLEIRGVREARLLGRPARFTARLDAGGAERLCHLHDPGRLRHLLRVGARVLYREAWRPGRRTSCDVVAVEAPGGVLVLEDTRLPNRLLPAALPHVLPGYRVAGSEVQANGTRVDFVAQAPGGAMALVEVKGTNLVEDGVALFPDAPSRRAHRQLQALAAAAAAGAAEAHIVFTILRPDAGTLRPHRRVDPVFARLLCSLRGRLHYHAYRVEAVEDNDRLLVRYAGPVAVEPC
jgi:sugar fermentation stimulation protein A